MAVCPSPRRPYAVVSLIRQMLVLALPLLLLAPPPAWAQGDDNPHFGVTVSLAPQWKSRSDLLMSVGLEDVGTVKGSEFAIGFVRGRTFGGEWGVSFVRKPFRDSTSQERSEDIFECGPSCLSTTIFARTTTLQDVYLRGVEVHWAPMFVTIRRRVQIGLNVAGGIGFPEGSIHETMELTNITMFDGQTETHTSTDSFTAPAREVFFEKVPLFKVEAQGAVILAPGFKIKVAGGLNNPGVGARIAAVYLIGAQ